MAKVTIHIGTEKTNKANKSFGFRTQIEDLPKGFGADGEIPTCPNVSIEVLLELVALYEIQRFLAALGETLMDSARAAGGEARYVTNPKEADELAQRFGFAEPEFKDPFDDINMEG